jgi:preprotein translocase subunit SecB
MKVSSFQFTNPVLSYMSFRENKAFTFEEGKSIEIPTNVNVCNTRQSESEAVVSLQIRLGNNDNNTPFSLDAEFVAQFRWEIGLSNEAIDAFLKQNAPALLLSYARPIISMTTNASRFPAYNIPFINFTETEEK